jgi:vancomycin resistance protein VanJ
MSAHRPNSFKRTLQSAIRKTAWLFIWLISLGMLLFFLLHWLLGDSLKQLRAVTFVTPWLLVISLPLLALAWISRRKRLALVLIAASVLVTSTFVPLFLPGQRSVPPADNVSFTVMSFNLHGIDDISGIVEIIRQEKPDILLIQEYSPALVDPSFHGLDDLYPELYIDVTPSEYGQAIFSRFPLRQAGKSYQQGRAEKVVVETAAGPIAIWNVHPLPPLVLPTEYFDGEIAALVDAISQTKGPLIVAGDFNATDQSDAYRAVNRYLKNAHAEAGFGFGFTFPARPYTLTSLKIETGPMWRIDHIFHTPDLMILAAGTLSSAGGTDHLPVIATISVSK